MQFAATAVLDSRRFLARCGAGQAVAERQVTVDWSVGERTWSCLSPCNISWLTPAMSGCSCPSVRLFASGGIADADSPSMIYASGTQDACVATACRPSNWLSQPGSAAAVRVGSKTTVARATAGYTVSLDHAIAIQVIVQATGRW